MRDAASCGPPSQRPREAVVDNATCLENRPATMPLELPELVDRDARNDRLGDVA